MELLCRCDDIPDDGIELRVLKGLLTAVTSNAVHVHGQALLLVSLTTSGGPLRVVQQFSDTISTSQDLDLVLHGLHCHICHGVCTHSLQELPVWQSRVAVKWPSI